MTTVNENLLLKEKKRIAAGTGIRGVDTTVPKVHQKHVDSQKQYCW